jgi:hypothetical protein
MGHHLGRALLWLGVTAWLAFGVAAAAGVMSWQLAAFLGVTSLLPFFTFRLIRPKG